MHSIATKYRRLPDNDPVDPLRQDREPLESGLCPNGCKPPRHSLPGHAHPSTQPMAIRDSTPAITPIENVCSNFATLPEGSSSYWRVYFTLFNFCAWNFGAFYSTKYRRLYVQLIPCILCMVVVADRKRPALNLLPASLAEVLRRAQPVRYFTADPHFGHERILDKTFSSRPFTTIKEHDDYIIDRINAHVMATDELFIIGDFCFSKKPGHYRNRIKCRQVHLIWGNHDQANFKLQFSTVDDVRIVKLGTDSSGTENRRRSDVFLSALRTCLLALVAPRRTCCTSMGTVTTPAKRLSTPCSQAARRWT